MKRQKGFTLVELLIAIGIIALLAGLIFAVLPAVRERGRIAHCVNSLKQVGAALHMYAQDYDGFAPPYTNATGIDTDYRYLPNTNVPALFKAAYWPYTKDKQIWYCPNDPFAGMDTSRTRPPREFGGDVIWRAAYWNGINHEATSYMVFSFCGWRIFAPIRIDNPPTYSQYSLVTKSRLLGGEPQEPLPYALDFLHGDVAGSGLKFGIYLRFDGTIKRRKTR